MQGPLISVVLPVFNAERTLAAAVRSILSQTYERFELIATDDGSTDTSPKLLSELATQDHRISVIRTQNRGVALALNTGLQAAKGSLIARMDADDISEPRRFEKQVAHLARYKECVAVGCRMTLVDDDNNPLPKQQKIPLGIRTRDRCNNFRHFPPSPPAIPHPTTMFRSAPIKAIGGYRAYFPRAEDRDLWWRLAEQGEIHCLPERLYRYRMHEGSISLRYAERMAADAFLSDLSAIARYYGLDDTELLEDYNSTRLPAEAIRQYVKLIGHRYPVSRLATVRAIKRGLPLLAGHENRSSAFRFALLQLLRNPLCKKRRRLVSNVLGS